MSGGVKPDQSRATTALGTRFTTLGDFACLDVDRVSYSGVAEVVYAASKTAAQTFAILQALRAANPDKPALATKCPEHVLEQAARKLPGECVIADHVGRTLVVGPLPAPADSSRRVAVVSAGTSDEPVARECLTTLGFLAVAADHTCDVGIAGLGRLLGRLPELRRAACVIAIAGMEGALASVLAGLVASPVIGVPTSVGYGVAAGGSAAMTAMLASCSPGLVVVNVDNGFGAAVHAAKILTVR